MKLITIAICIAVIASNSSHAQNVGIGTTAPDPSAMLDIQSINKGLLLPRMNYVQRLAIPAPVAGLMVYQTDNAATARGFYTYGADGWKRSATEDEIGGGGLWTLNGSNQLVTAQYQFVGIGTNAPSCLLDVNGSIRARANVYFDYWVGIGTQSPSAKLQINNGVIRMYHTANNVYWDLGYDSVNNAFHIDKGTSPRLVVEDAGNVGIGTASPAARLDVQGDAKVSGALTVDNGKGMMVNGTSDAELKHYTRQAAFTLTGLPPHGVSAEGTVNIANIFTSPPAVYAGNIVVTGGTGGQLYDLFLQIYDVGLTNFKIRIVNLGTTTITQTITWNIMCIGE